MSLVPLRPWIEHLLIDRAGLTLRDQRRPHQVLGVLVPSLWADMTSEALSDRVEVLLRHVAMKGLVAVVRIGKPLRHCLVEIQLLQSLVDSRAGALLGTTHFGLLDLAHPQRLPAFDRWQGHDLGGPTGVARVALGGSDLDRRGALLLSQLLQ